VPVLAKQAKLSKSKYSASWSAQERSPDGLTFSILTDLRKFMLTKITSLHFYGLRTLVKNDD